jgi:hypothetical protein
MRNSIDKKILSNIEISDQMKQDILEGCKEGKKSGDFKFRNSTALMALMLVAAFSITTVSVSAAVMTFKQRLQNMGEKEVSAYTTEVDKDTFASLDEGFSRELSNSEIERSLTIERKYYDDGVFPEKEMAHYKTKAEMADDEIAYVEDDNMVYLPTDDMTDEQLLQYIDHDAKKRYINIQKLKEEGDEPGRGVALESTKVKEGSGESKAVEAAKKEIKKSYGVEIDDSYVVLVSYFGEEDDEPIPLYNLFIYQPGLGYGDQYNLRFKADDNSLMYCYCGNFKGEVKPIK